jgi:hypothetical protein
MKLQTADVRARIELLCGRRSLGSHKATERFQNRVGPMDTLRGILARSFCAITASSRRPSAHRSAREVAGLIQISLNGTVTPVIPWTGIYSVNPDNCTMTKTAVIPGVGIVHFFVTAGARFKELRFMATDKGTAISGTARKQWDSR